MIKLSKEEWRTAIVECRKSRCSVRSWCTEHDLSHKAFYYWERKLREDNKASAPSTAGNWVSMDQMLSNEPVMAQSQSKLTIHISGVSIDVSPGFQQSLLA